MSETNETSNYELPALTPEQQREDDVQNAWEDALYQAECVFVKAIKVLLELNAEDEEWLRNDVLDTAGLPDTIHYAIIEYKQPTNLTVDMLARDSSEFLEDALEDCGTDTFLNWDRADFTPSKLKAFYHAIIHEYLTQQKLETLYEAPAT